MTNEEIEVYLPIIKQLASKTAYVYHRVLIIDKNDIIQECYLALLQREARPSDNERVMRKIVRSVIARYIEQEANDQGVAVYSVSKVLWLLNNYRDVMEDYGPQAICYENSENIIAEVDYEEKLVELIDIKHVMEQLPLDLQQVLILACFENKSQAEIAQEIGCSPQHAGRLYKKAIRELYLRLHGIREGD
jgi:RNA polymerase sigma factor (sigma-70 family)